MCCRFRFECDDDEIIDLIHFEEVFKCKYPQDTFPHGDICPSMTFPVLIKGNAKAEIELMKWGYESPVDNKLIINARGEGINSKYMFKKDIKDRRCVIIATSFYEWSQDANHFKHSIKVKNRNVIYFAGLYQIKDGKENFAILTHEANEDMKTIHSRMPVIIEKNEILDYLKNDDNVNNYLTRIGPELAIRRC